MWLSQLDKKLKIKYSKGSICYPFSHILQPLYKKEEKVMLGFIFCSILTFVGLSGMVYIGLKEIFKLFDDIKNLKDSKDDKDRRG